MTESFDSAVSAAPVPFPVGTWVKYASWRHGVEIYGVVAEVMKGRFRAITVKDGEPNIVVHTDALTLADPPPRKPMCGNCRHWDAIMETDADGREVPSGEGWCRAPNGPFKGAIFTAGGHCIHHAFTPSDQPRPDPDRDTGGDGWQEAEAEREAAEEIAAADLIRVLQATNEAQAREIAAHADAIAVAVSEEREDCALIAASGALVPPDGGAPTEGEFAVADGIAAAIRARGGHRPDYIEACRLKAARRKGAQEMRERCAQVAANWPIQWAQERGYDCVGIALAIRAEPLP